MNINFKNVGMATVATGLALALSGCGMGNSATTDTRSLAHDAQPEVTATADAGNTAQPSVTPSVEPSPIAVEDIDVQNDNGWGYDASQVEVPEEVRSVFGDAADTVVNNALMITHIGYAEMPDFLTPGWSTEDYDLSWTSFSENFLDANLRNEMDGDDSRRNLMLAIPQDGVVGTLDGVEYTIPAGTVGLDYELATNPVVALADSGDAVYVGFDLKGEFNSEPAHSTHDLYVHYNLVPAGEDGNTDWVIQSYTIETANTTVVGG